MLLTSHFNTPVPTYTHSTSTWLPIFSLAVLNVTVFAAAFPFATMSADPVITRFASAVYANRNDSPFCFAGSVKFTAAVAKNSNPLSFAVTV
jgi:hypothetical protein